MTTKTEKNLRDRAKELGLIGLLEHWDELDDLEFVGQLIEWEEQERKKRSLERRLRSARIGRFKDMADFDWTWPKKIDRQQVEDLFRLRWADEPSNIILVGPNGVGKSMIEQNLAHQAVLRGYSVRCVSASVMLNDLVMQDGATALQRRLRAYCQPQILCIDELGYLSYDSRHADLLFEVISRRYGNKPTVITTNKPFAEWGDVFPNATCVVTLVDRLVHHAEIVSITGESYRLKEAKEEERRRVKERSQRRNKKKASRATGPRQKPNPRRKS